MMAVAGTGVAPEALPHPVVLSYLQVQPLLDARRQGRASVAVSPDLGLSSVEALLGEQGVRFPAGSTASWEDLRRVVRDEPTCFEVTGEGARKIHRFSDLLNRQYTLIATRGAPTLVNSGFTMHRVVDVDPREDTLRKIRAFGAVHGRVLDTATGLGYTAIEAARTARRVVTVEIDPLVLEVAALNPWSRALFGNPRIEQRIGDSFEVVAALGDEQFDGIMHDPPTVSLAGDLYGGQFYRRLYRVLRRGGVLFHYVGNLGSKQGGSVAKGVVRRLQEAGFSGVTPRPEAFGILARKA
jgi:uncharacterized protein